MEKMTSREDEMSMFLRNFAGNEDRLKKYMELILFHDEKARFNYMVRENLRRICVTLTTKCNLKCVWCHRHDSRFKDYINREMPFDMLKLILPGLKGFSWLHYGGLGEPLLYPKLLEAISEAKRYIPNVKITTNATLLKQEKCRLLADSGLTLLEVSIDGFDSETNKKVRGVNEDSLIENIVFLSKISDISIQVNIVVSEANYRSLFNAVDKLRDVNNLTKMHAIPLFMTDHMIEKGIRPITDEQLKTLLMHWDDRIKTMDLDVELWPDVYEADLDPVIIAKRRCNICFAVYDDPFINVFGYLSPCGRLQNLHLDDVSDIGFDRAWNGSKMLEWRRNQIFGKYAKECQRECYMQNT